MGDRVGFCVLYQFRVSPGHEDAFCAAWTQLTESIRARHGGMGSRLHRAADRWWVAYAQWPDRATWEASQTATVSADPKAQQAMAAAIEERRPPLPLEPQIDLLSLCRAGPPT